MKTRDRRRLRKRNVAWLDAMLNDGLPRRERITLAMRLVSGMRSGGKRGDAKARARSLRGMRIEALAPIAREIVTDAGCGVSRDYLADRLRLRLSDLDPFDEIDAELETRAAELWPHGLPSRIRLRQLVASLTAEEWSSWTLPLPNADGVSR